MRTGRLPRSASELMSWVVCVALALAMAQAPAEAANERVAGLFDFLFNPQPQSQPATRSADAPRRKKRPKRRLVREKDVDRPQYRDARQYREVRRPVYVRPVTAPAPKVQPTFFVAVLGDNLGVQLDQGLQDAFSEQPEIGFLHKAKEGSGLARDDWFDWVKAAKDILASKERIDIAVILLGSNDAQALHQGTSIYDLNSDKWKEVYAQRVAAIAQAFKDKNIALVWVGIPVMRNPRLAAQAAIANDIVRTEATKAGVTYIDSWQAFVNDQGDYDDYGPDATGQRIKLRAADGVHFTKAGARKMALFVEPDIRRALENSKPGVEEMAKTPSGSIADIDLPPQPTVDINALILRELAVAAKAPGAKGGRAAPSNAQIEARLPVPAPALEVVLPVKPAAGAVIALTAPPSSPGGELAQPIIRTAATAKVSDIVERALVLGLPVEARPGRSDDFRWPPR